MFKVHFVLFVLAAGAGTIVNGLQCYSCRQNVPNEVVGALPPGLPSLPQIHDQCLSDPTAARNETCTGLTTYCAKIYAKIDDKEAVIRTCLNPSELYYDNKSGCFNAEVEVPSNVKDFKACFCTDNNCNSSPKMVTGTGMTIGILLISIFKNFQ